MKHKLINTFFIIAALICAFFAMVMYVKYESTTSMKTVIFKVPSCKAGDLDSVCHGVVSR